MRVVLKHNDKLFNLTERVGSLGSSDSIDSLSREVSFSYAYNRNDRYTLDGHPSLGDGIILQGKDGVFFKGIIVSYTDGFAGSVNFRCLDDGYLLGRNEVSMQFMNLNTAEAIKLLCKKYEIKHEVCKMKTKVSKNFFGEPISEVIKDLIGMETFRTGKKYRFEVDQGTLKVMDYKDLEIKPRHQGAINLGKVESLAYMSNLNIDASLEEMYNNIIVMKNGKIVKEESDKESIKKYGRFSKVFVDEDINLKQTLKTLNKTSAKISLTLLGDERIKSGRILVLDSKKYLVTSTTHDFSGRTHTVSVELQDAKVVSASVEAVDPNKDKEETNDITSSKSRRNGGRIRGKQGDGKGRGYYVWPVGAYCVPTTYPGHWNNANDFPVPYGTPIYACDGGVVTWVQNSTIRVKFGNLSYGRCVKITHSSTRWSLYAHMSVIGVSQGQRVSQGQVIGYVGNTGNSYGAHLHLEISENNVGIRPSTVVKYGRR